MPVENKDYFIYNNNGTFYLSSLNNCKVPTASDGASWNAKRSIFSGNLTPLDNSGASGKVYLPAEKTIYRGFMYNAYSASNDVNNKVFGYNDDRIDNWEGVKGMWAKGFFMFQWADNSLPIASIDKTKRVINLEWPASYGIGNQTYFFVYNLIEELDEEGEYYIDRDERKVYAIFHKTPKEIWITHSTSVVLNIDHVNNIKIENLDFKYNPDNFITIIGDQITIKECSFYHTGKAGALITGNMSNFVQNKVVDVGTKGVVMTCGDRVNLLNGSCSVSQNYFSEFSQNHYTYTPAIILEGVGNIATHNFIENSPCQAITFSGNEHEISYNKIQNVCFFMNDAGAIYSGRRWDWRGNVIKYNYISNVIGWDNSSCVQGIYLDDMLSGETVFGNVMKTIRGIGVQHGGGRDNNITNNIMYDCDFAYSGDSRGSTWMYSTLPYAEGNLLERCNLEGVNRLEEPWKSKYPELYEIPNSNDQIVNEKHWLYPENCVVDCNVPYQSKKWDYYVDASVTSNYKVYNKNKYNSSVDPLFVDADNGDLRLKDDSPVLNMECWKQIPFEEIGIQIIPKSATKIIQIIEIFLLALLVI
ncbi:hypothetical protein EIN_208930 [Entamoeba invadens IP1]|uniref:Right handed beta helix domain-containing protein n=1 Tax=Entamoeba invadens IP1 TaxID=370355 RepID=L7FQF2_ENTIV|nr:hypothetical protein EIN_208930 [Entamoeba invadens IP1]ELP94504.1 hypothetical protein EIN_208930 [Entamoeba invadens IP1]|eukprot:XP_004261275.1 hypothetical protein EIN_208930 [Entamoeba invadens IP1]